MSIPSRACAAALLAASLAGCNGIGNALGGGGGVMPDTEVGPPPSARTALPGRQTRSAAVDEDGAPVPSTPTRQLALPKAVRGEGRTADAGVRKIEREDIEGYTPNRSSASSMSPALTPGGNVGMGGRF